MSLQQFDGILKMKDMQKDRKRKSCKSAETCMKKFVKLLQEKNLILADFSLLEPSVEFGRWNAVLCSRQV